MRIDLNADLGEGFGPWTMGDDAAMMDIITTANVACGFHAGDPVIMRNTVGVAREKGVRVGAHPGFSDLAGFGRRRISGISVNELEAIVAYQIGAMQSVATLAGHPITHVKTHGALGNMCADDDAWALGVARAIKAADPTLLFMIMPGTATERAADRTGLASLREIYADRTYDDSFNLTDRSKPGAVIHDAALATEHVLRMLNEGAIISTSGKRLDVGIDSICVHGDNPAAVVMARTLRSSLESQGVTVAAYEPS
ncbi:5-oxoprolinase subunit PxpA [Methylobacterium terricola]|uniref:5-oxoprolinase subunit A n=1 Tax=Methylobacterium terricola TaxID=2583531 RepID=A0A5C4LM70_9HYPH|nr:5-oxoprolinase subunit PxpA [Methylobacterium terricola]TNC14477.1 5-oxoprolinase subunit PxpA [Methylobacterium terricola]